MEGASFSTDIIAQYYFRLSISILLTLTPTTIMDSINNLRLPKTGKEKYMWILKQVPYNDLYKF